MLQLRQLFFLLLLSRNADMLFQLFEADYHAVLLRECLYLCGQLEGVTEVNDKYAVENANKEGKQWILREPAYIIEYHRVYQEIIYPG